MRTHFSLDWKSKTDLGRISGKNFPIKEKWIKFAYKFANSITKSSSKIQEFKIYIEVINNFIHENK